MNDLEATNEAIRLRGLFVQRYSGVEWAIAALILYAQQHQAYANFKGLPWSWSGKPSKLNRIHQLLENGGPLDVHAHEIRAHLQSFAELDERRNFMVHAIMTRHKDPQSGLAFRFAMFRPTKEGTDYGSMLATLDELAALADAVQPISSGVTELVSKIIHSLPVDPIVAIFDDDAPPPFGLKLGSRL